jgi:hypothetical protein
MTESLKVETAVQTSGAKMPGKALFICALVFSLWPLVIGVSIFFLWLLTRSSMFEYLGFLTIMGGLCSVVIAFVLWFIYVCVAIIAMERVGKIILNAVLVLVAIIINFPAALACIAGYDYINSLYMITVDNKSSTTIQQVTVSGSCTTTNLGPILPGGKKNVKFPAESEGPLFFSVSSNGLKIDGVLDEGYATRGPGENTTLTIKDGGKYVVEGRPPFVD